ncbi:MAG: cysteine desulfurase family protein [Minisyncoccia bacterium]
MLKKEIYLDYAASTPIDSRVLSVVKKTEKKFWKNPSSLHSGGVEAFKYLNSLRTGIAEVLFAHSDEIFFTSGGTESNNLAIRGVLKSFENKSASVLVSAIDHSSIIETVKSLDKKIKVVFLPVTETGKISTEFLKKELLKKPTLLSFGYVNGEIGTVQDVREIMKMVRHHRKVNKTATPYVHIDATQAANVFSCEVHKLGIDLMTLDGSKIYGPKGVGMLFIRRGVPVAPIVYGGGQEQGKRSGTENLPAISGFYEALRLAQKDKEKNFKSLKSLQSNFIKSVLSKIPQSALNGPVEVGEKPDYAYRHPGIASFCFAGADAEQAVLILDSFGIAVSPSSSCQNLAERSNSYVVEALSHSSTGNKSGGNAKDKCALSSIRFSFGKFSKISDLKYVVKCLKKAVDDSKGKKITLL